MTENTLYTDVFHDQLVVIDSDGGVWFPFDEATAEIGSSDYPEAKAIAICDAEPTRGEWVR